MNKNLHVSTGSKRIILYISFMGALVVIFLTASYFNHKSFKENFLAHTKSQLQTFAESNSSILENRLKNVIDDLVILAKNPYIHRLKRTDSMYNDGEWYSPGMTYYNKHIDIVDIYQRISPDGKVLSVHPYYKKLLGSKLSLDKITGGMDPAVNEVMVQININDPPASITCTAPVRDININGETRGYLRIVIFLDKFDTWLGQINLKRNGMAWLEDKDKTIISQPEGEHLGKKYDSLFIPSQLLTEKKEITLGDKKIYLGVNLNVDEINRDINSHLLRSLFLIALAAILVFVPGIILYRKEKNEAVVTAKHESEMKFSTLMDNSSDMIFLTDSSGRVIFLNRAALDNYDLTLEESKNIYLPFFWCSDSIDTIFHKLEESRKIRSTVTANADCENQHFNIAISPVIINKNIAWMLCIARDITRIIEAEELLLKNNQELNAALEELEATNEEFESQNEQLLNSQEQLGISEERFRNIVEASPMGIHIYEIEDKNRLVFSGSNRAADTILKTDCSQFMGKTIEEAFPPLADTDIPERYRKAAIYGEHWYTEQINYDDKTIVGAYEVYAFQIKPGTMGALFTDITERKKTEAEIIKAREEAEKASESKNIFLATMSHEIRTPMNAIIGMTDLAMMTGSDEERFDFLLTVKDSASHLMSLISDILDYSKIEENQLRLIYSNFNLVTTLEYVQKSLSPEALAKGLELILDVSKIKKELVYGDRERIMQILLNLTSNAIKFTETGHVIISAEYNPVLLKIDDDSNKNFMIVEISDTGSGIPESEIENIFNSFTQVDGTYTRKHGGAGLGLSISKRIADTMDGEIKVDSIMGSGSTFTLKIPLMPSSYNKTRSIESKKSIHEFEKTENYDILLAEDNAVNAKLIDVSLKKLGHRITVAVDGIEALDKLKESNFHLVLMDIEMPRMDGLEATRIIRSGEAGEKNRSIPIIAITAHVLDDVMKQCREAGMNDYVSKPIDIRELASTISKSVISKNYS